MNRDENRLNFRMKPETAEKLEHWYKADHCRSRNEFVEKAVNFFMRTHWRRRTVPHCRWQYRPPSTGG